MRLLYHYDQKAILGLENENKGCFLTFYPTKVSKESFPSCEFISYGVLAHKSFERNIYANKSFYPPHRDCMKWFQQHNTWAMAIISELKKNKDWTLNIMNIMQFENTQQYISWCELLLKITNQSYVIRKNKKWNDQLTYHYSNITKLW